MSTSKWGNRLSEALGRGERGATTPAHAKAAWAGAPGLKRRTTRTSGYANSGSALALVTDRTQEIVPPVDVALCFDAFWRCAVNDAKHSLALLCPGHNDFDWVCGGTKYRTDLR